MNTSIRTVSISGLGSYLPERILTNQELEKMVDTTNEWIVTRTGITQRHIAAPDQAASDLGAEAARRAMEQAKVSPEQIDMIVAATISPDMPFPNTACFIQHKLGAKKAFCFGIEAACSGFVYGLEIGRQFVASGSANTVLVVGAEKLSAITDWKDRATCVLFGDGAGAAILQPTTEGRGLISSVMGSDGSLTNLLMCEAGGSRLPASHETVDKRQHFIKMEGKEVFKNAVRCMSDACVKVLEKAGMTSADVKWVVPHQANTRIVTAIADRLELPMEKVIMNLPRVGNTSGASIPLALDEAVRSGKVKKGDIIVFVAFGGGFTWGATVMEWGY